MPRRPRIHLDGVPLRCEISGDFVPGPFFPVASDISQTLAHRNIGGEVCGRLVVDEVPVIYRASPRPDGSINVGTIHPDDGRWVK
jgi:hypothetical protein